MTYYYLSRYADAVADYIRQRAHGLTPAKFEDLFDEAMLKIAPDADKDTQDETFADVMEAFGLTAEWFN